MDILDKEINNLVSALGKGTLPELVIKRRYKDLEKKQKELRTNLNKIDFELNGSYEYSYDLESIMKYIKDFKNSYGYLDFDEKRKLLKSIVKEIIVDGDKVKMKLYFLFPMRIMIICHFAYTRTSMY